MKSVLPRLVFLFGFLTLVIIGSTQALFSDFEQSVGNIFQASENPQFELLVNGQHDPEAVVDINDLKPGDNKVAHKTVRVNGDGDTANIFVHLKDLEASQGAQFEPEVEEENQNGEQFDIQNYLTYDLSIGGETIIDFDDGLLLPDAVSCWIPLGTIDQNVDVGVEQSFHFDEDVTNWAQGDVLHFTEEFLALSPDAPPPGTPEGSDRVWDPIQKQCTNQPTECTQVWASGYSNVAQGLRKNGSAVLPDRSDPNAALGVAQSSGAAFDSPVINGSFFSLGFGGQITLSFANPVYNTTGDDLTIFEVTGGTSYPAENVRVEASLDGSLWTTLIPSLTRDGGVEFGALPSALYVRLTDISDPTPFEVTADGYDLDAVRAECGTADATPPPPVGI